ncbi:MAG TPA: hypothetical protein ENN28_00965 [Candidatus Uhrbacteria bacterium]|nr:hypothetical protein [Candidatus Uhrbacteria bacterium]
MLFSFCKKVIINYDRDENDIFSLLAVLLILHVFPIYFLNDKFGLDLLNWEWGIALLAGPALALLLWLYYWIFAQSRSDGAFTLLNVSYYLLLLMLGSALAFFPLYYFLRMIDKTIDWQHLNYLLIAVTLLFNVLVCLIFSLRLNFEAKKYFWAIIIAVIGLVSLVAPFILVGKVFWHRSLDLEGKIIELQNLQQELIQKRDQVNDLIKVYQEEITILSEEIRQDSRAVGVNIFNQAQNHQRIVLDLKLIQMQKAYIAKLEETNSRLQNGIYELQYLERQARIDLKIYEILPDDEVREMIFNINKTINLYMPEAKELVLEVDPAMMPSQEQIWEEIFRGE